MIKFKLSLHKNFLAIITVKVFYLIKEYIYFNNNMLLSDYIKTF